jgi:hypothetical protein
MRLWEAHMPEPLGWVIECLILVAALRCLARVAPGRSLLALTLGSFTVRLAIGEALFLISSLGLPILRSKQLPGGFWAFGYDGFLFHNQALEALGRASAFNQSIAGSSGSPPNGLRPLSRLLAFLYAILGSNPSVGLMVVAAAAGGAVPLAYTAAQACGLSRRQCLMVAILIAAWPSSFIWSGQVLKDPLEWFGFFAVCAGILVLLNLTQPRSWRTLLAAVLALAVGVLLTATLRPYAAAAFLVATLLGLVVFVVAYRERFATSLTTGSLILGAVVIGILPGFGSIASFPGIFSSTGQPSVQSGLSALRAFLAAPIPAPVAKNSTSGEPSPASRAAVATAAAEPAGSPVATSAALAVPASEGAGAVSQPQVESDIEPSLLVKLYAPECILRAYRDTHGSLPGNREELMEWVSQVGDPHARDLVEVCQYMQHPRALEPQCDAFQPLIRARTGYINSGGASQLDGSVQFTDCLSVLVYLPRAAELAFIAPLPTEWRQFGATIGPLRYFVPLEALLLWAAFPGLAVGLVHALRDPNKGKLILTIYVLLLGLVLGLVVTNFGTLFRLRLAVVLPGMLLAVEGWSLILQALRRQPAVKKIMGTRLGTFEPGLPR